MTKKFQADVKYYDPDKESDAEFDTWEEAEEWFRVQTRYGSCSMWLNSKPVKLHNGVLVNNEPIEGARPTHSDVLATLARANIDFDHIFRPQPTRGSAPSNPATLLAKGEAV